MSDLKPFARNLWIADGPNARDFGVTFTTRMSIARLSDGSLWVNSPVSVRPETLQRITELGVKLSCSGYTKASLAAGGVAHALSRGSVMGLTAYSVYTEESPVAKHRYFG